LLTAASVNDRRTLVRPLQTERSVSDADDNLTALYAPPTARFTDLGMSVFTSELRLIAEVQRDVAVLRICAIALKCKYFRCHKKHIDAMDVLTEEVNSDSWIAPDCALIFGRRREII
jgi:hypothetical protein